MVEIAVKNIKATTVLINLWGTFVFFPTVNVVRFGT